MKQETIDNQEQDQVEQALAAFRRPGRKSAQAQLEQRLLRYRLIALRYQAAQLRRGGRDVRAA